MEELFAVDLTTLIVLVALVLFIVFLVIYKSKQNSYYRTDEKAHSEEVKKTEKIKEFVETKEKKSPTFAEMEKETEFYIDWASIFAFSLILQLRVIQVIGVFDSPEKNFALSFAIMIVLYFVVIKPIIRWMDL